MARISRISFRSPGRLLRGILCALSIWLAAAWAAEAKIYALVIGIDRYEHITPLRGAVNDAVDIASAISTLGPEQIELLLDEKATREAVLSKWARYLEIAAPGDTIIITFAGHGANEPAHDPSLEEDGQDETFLLAGFSPSGAPAGQRIRDDEIADMIARRPDVEHILVADSCHSGTALRSTQFDLGYRFFDHDGLTEDPLPPPPPPPSNSGSDTDPGLNNSVFFAAVGDDELAPEINIEGQIRGALSYAFAQGLRGEADRDEDGLITKGELEIHIRRRVKSLLSGRQKPRVSPVGEINKPLFALESVLRREDSAFSSAFVDLPPVPLLVQAETAAAPLVAAVFSGADPVADLQQNGILVDFDAEEIRSGSGDLLRSLTREVNFDWRLQIQATVDKMRIVNHLSDRAVDSKIDVSFPFGDTLYFKDDPLNVLITGRSTRHVTILNLSSEGRLQWLYPRYPPIDAVSGFDDPRELDPNTLLSFDAYVLPPFGSEHIIVIETTDPHNAVRRAAHRFDGTDKLNLFWRELNIALSDVPHAVGVHNYVTTERP